MTETDKQCEAIILSKIQAAFPDHKFIGEEGSAAQVGLCSWTLPSFRLLISVPLLLPWRRRLPGMMYQSGRTLCFIRFSPVVNAKLCGALYAGIHI